MTHTPGPWKAVKVGNTKVTQAVIADTQYGFHLIATTHPIPIENTGRQEENARLIAAAPELLEALEAIRREPQGCPMCDAGVLRNKDKNHWPDCPYEMARAAIAKARGEE